jgi:hypothetical protein
MAFVRSRPCCVTGMTGDLVVAHHVRCFGHGGTGLKPPDYLCVPLTGMEHHQLHQMGEKTYWGVRGVDPAAMVIMTMLVYLSQFSSKEMIDDLGRIISQ